MKKIVSLVLMFLGVSLFAGDAKGCISVGYHDSKYGPSSDSQTLKNRCSYKVEVVWCHNNNAKKFKDGRCGRKGKFYQKHTVLKPGEVKQNQYSLPRSGTIYYGACKGGYYSTITKKWNDGTYQCKNR